MGRTNNDDSLITTVENHALYTRTTSRSTMNITKTNNRQSSGFPSSPAALYTSSTVKSTLSSSSCSWTHQRSHHFHFPNDHRQQQPPQLQRDDYHLMVSWPPVSYTCSFCRREFRSAQALGGHMNVHRRDRARLRSSSSSTSSSHDYSSPNSTTSTILSSKSAANYNPSLNLNLDPTSPNPNPSHRSLITRTHPSSSIDASITPAASSPSNHFTFNPNVGGLISSSGINTVRNNNPVHYSIGSDTTPSMEKIRVERRRGGGPFDPKNFLAVRSSILSAGGGGGNNTTKNKIRGDADRAYHVDSYKRSVGGDEADHLNHGLLEDISHQKKKNGMLSEYLTVTQIGLGTNVAAFGDDDDDEVEFMSVEGGDDLGDDQVDLELRLGYNY